MPETGSPESTDSAILERLRAVPSAVLADAMEVLKLPDAVLPAAVRCLAGEKFAGRARTLLKAPRPANATQQDVAPGKAGDLYDLIDSCKAGDVIVLAVGGDLRSANFGGNMAERAAILGVSGVVTDGALRDLADFRRLGLSAFGAGASPRSSRGHFVTLAHDVPVVCGGVHVRPGDYVVGDADGVVIIAASRVEDVLAAAAGFEAKDEAVREALAQGSTLAEAVKKFSKS